MRPILKAVLGASSVIAMSLAAHAESITIATVNNGDMVRMQKLASEFTKANPDITLNWVTLEENALREKVTTDIATKGRDGTGVYLRNIRNPPVTDIPPESAVMNSVSF